MFKGLLDFFPLKLDNLARKLGLWLASGVIGSPGARHDPIGAPCPQLACQIVLFVKKSRAALKKARASSLDVAKTTRCCRFYFIHPLRCDEITI